MSPKLDLGIVTRMDWMTSSVRGRFAVVGDPAPISADVIDEIAGQFGFAFPPDARWIFENWGSGTFGQPESGIFVSPWLAEFVDRSDPGVLVLHAGWDDEGWPVVGPGRDGLFPWGLHDDAVVLAWRVYQGWARGVIAFWATSPGEGYCVDGSTAQFLHLGARDGFESRFLTDLFSEGAHEFHPDVFHRHVHGEPRVLRNIQCDVGAAEVLAVCGHEAWPERQFEPGHVAGFRPAPDGRSLLITVDFVAGCEGAVRGRALEYFSDKGWSMTRVTDENGQPAWADLAE
jgi:hypothetical protein